MKSKHIYQPLIAFLITACLTVSAAWAQTTYTWSNSNITATPPTLLDWFSGGSNTQGIWTGGNPVSSNLNTIQFFADTTTALTNTAAATQTVNLNNGGSAFQLGTLTLSGLASATANANLTMTLSGDALNFSGATGTINLNALNATRTITYNVNNNIQLGTASSGSVLTLGGAGTGIFNFGGIISELQVGGGSVVKNGASTVTLAGANSYTGGTTLSAGRLNLNSASAIGTGTLAIGNGTTLGNTSGGAITLSTNNAQTWSGNFTFAGTSDLNLGTGAVALGAATRTVTVSANKLAIGGQISGGGAAVGLTKAGAGVLSLDAANTYTGTTTVSDGVLLLNNANALPGGVGASGGTSGLTFNGGVVGLTSDFSRSIGTSASQVQWAASGGFAAYGADRTVNLGGNVTPSAITWANTAANGGFNGQTLSLGAAAATHTVELVNPIDLGATNRTVTVTRGSANIDAKFSGNLTGSGTLILNGVTATTGNLARVQLTGSNSFGGLSIGGASLVVINDADALGTGVVGIGSVNNASGFASNSPTPLTIQNQVALNGSNDGRHAARIGHADYTGDLVLAGGLDWSAPLASSATIVSFEGPVTIDLTGPISGPSKNFGLSSQTTLRFMADNSAYTNNLGVNGSSGTVVLGNPMAMGSGTKSLNSYVRAEVDLTGANALTNVSLGSLSGDGAGQSTNLGAGFTGTNSIEIAGSTDLKGYRWYINDISGGSLLFSGSVVLKPINVGKDTFELRGSSNTTFSGNMSELSFPAKIIITNTGITTFSGSNSYTGYTTVTGGGLVLDYSTQDNSKLADSAVLTVGGAALVLKGGSHTETVGSTTLNNGGSTISRDGGTSVLQFNAISRGSQSTLAFGAASIATTDTVNVNGILGGWATVGNDWAVNSTNAADGAITALSSYTGALPTATGATTANYTLSGDQTQTAAVSANTVKITNTGNSETLSLGGNNLSLTAASGTSLGGILYAGGADGNYTIASTTGRIQPSTTSQELIFQANSGTLTVNAFVGANNGTGPVTKSGAGTLVLGAANNFTGALRVNQGALRLTNATGAGTTAGGITVQNGAALELANAIAVGAEALTLNGNGISNAGALRNISGTNTYAGLVTLGMNSRINSDAGTLNLTNVGTITGSGFGLSVGGAGNTSISSIIGTGAGTLTKDGAGTLTLSAANTYTGATTISEGTLQIDGSTHASSTVAIGTAGILTGSGTVNGNATLTGNGIINTSSATIAGTLGVTGGSWNGNGTVSGLVTASSGTFTIGNSATLTASSGVNVTGGTVVVNGTLSGGLTAAAGTTVYGSGTVTGTTTIAGNHNPGNSPGIQTFDDLSYTGGSAAVQWELNANSILNSPTVVFDQIIVDGDLDFTGATSLTLLFNGSGSTVNWTDSLWASNRSWTIYDVSGTTTNFNNLQLSTSNWADSGGNLFNTSLNGSAFSLAQSGNDVVLNYTVIPEPKAALLGGLGILLLLRRRRS